MGLRLIDVGDPVLASEAVTDAVDELVGDGDRSLMLEMLTEADYRDDGGGYARRHTIFHIPACEFAQRRLAGQTRKHRQACIPELSQICQ